MQKPKLYVDFDQTIVDSVEAIVSMYNEDYSAYKEYEYVDPKDIKTWEFKECQCASPEIIDTYFCTPRFFERLKFLENTNSLLWLLSYKFNIIIVSHGHYPNLKLKKEWIKEHLSFATFVGVDMDKYPDKSHVDMSNAIFVDDLSGNLFSSNAKYKILFGEYSWEDNYLGFTRCVDWIELYQQIIFIYGKEYGREEFA